MRGFAISLFLARLAPGPEICLDVEMRVAVLLIHPPALLHDLIHFCDTLGASFLVAVQRVAAGNGTGGGRVGIVGAEAVRVDVVGEDGMGFAWVWVGEVPPEIGDRLLRVVVVGQFAVMGDGGCGSVGFGWRAVFGGGRRSVVVWERHRRRLLGAAPEGRRRRWWFWVHGGLVVQPARRITRKLSNDSNYQRPRCLDIYIYICIYENMDREIWRHME